MLKDKLTLVPNKPGIYQMRNIDGNVIYVGKAKNLYKRVNSYFNREHTGKTKKLVSEIVDFNYVIANNELEAFIMEINLIKEIDPKYNILLRDDKSYSYIEYENVKYPTLRVIKYNKLKKNKNKKLFGPYPNGYAAKRIVNLINRLYPLKKCSGNPKELCLYYHIEECLGYCVKDVDKSLIDDMEKDILSFLRGNDKVLRDKILDKIKFYSDNLNYEMALSMKEELEYIDVVLDKQRVELHDFVDRDVCGYYYENGYLSICMFFIRGGKILDVKNYMFPTMDEYKDELEYFLVNFYTKHEVVKEVFVNDVVNTDMLDSLIDTRFIVPKIGDKKNILELVNSNAFEYYKKEIELILRDGKRSSGANDELMKLLGLSSLYRIDVFDNSNLFGEFAVSGMVVFKDGKPSKNDYRKYKISVDKNDDYNTMKEVIYRRYYHGLMDNDLPELIIVDGGELQIGATLEVLNSLSIDIPVVGLKKNDKHSTNELVGIDRVYDIDKSSDLFHYLTKMQDEVHRYTITYHRTLRSKGSISSVLDNVEGIGNVRKKELLKKFGSVSRIKDASIEELSKVVPLDVAKRIKELK